MHSDENTTTEVIAALTKTRFELTSKSITFGIEYPYIRDSLAANLKAR
jgi:hypothetical protein